jgi:hypothetical protein
MKTAMPEYIVSDVEDTAYGNQSLAHAFYVSQVHRTFHKGAAVFPGLFVRAAIIVLLDL